MNPENYTDEQRKDIEARVEKAKKYLTELQLQPACWMTPANVGGDVFGLKATAFLQDLKYTSPLTKNDV